jgi:hypothetical protein
MVASLHDHVPNYLRSAANLRSDTLTLGEEVPGDTYNQQYRFAVKVSTCNNLPPKYQGMPQRLHVSTPNIKAQTNKTLKAA